MTRPRRCRPRAEPRQAALLVLGPLRVEHPLFLLFAAALLLAWDGSGLVRLWLLCAALHESGHIFAYRLLAHRWPRVILSPFGLRLPLRGVFLRPWQGACLAAAGPLANLLACLAAHAVMAWCGASYLGYWFIAVNLLTAAANLLPLPALDGGRLLAFLTARGD